MWRPGILYCAWSGTNLIFHAFPSFDYKTISDVILHVSYTSNEKEDDGAYRTQVEEKLKNDFMTLASKDGLSRLISLKHDFPNAFYRLLNPNEGQNQKTEFTIGRNYFPYFLSKENITLTLMTTYLVPKQNESIDKDGLIVNITINSGTPKPFGPWNSVPEIPNTTIQQSSNTVSDPPVGNWKINAESNHPDINKLAKLDDLIILMQYKMQ